MAKNYLIINSNRIEKKLLVYYKNKNYKLICINLESALFCKNNKLKFYFFESFLNNQDKNFIFKKRIQIWNRIFNFKKSTSLIKKIITYDYYSLHYFLDSLITGHHLAKKLSFFNSNHIVYYGERIDYKNFFEFYSKKQNAIVLGSFFNHCNTKTKITFINQNSSNIYHINFFRSLGQKFINLMIRLIKKTTIIISIFKNKKKYVDVIFLNKNELFRFSNIKKKITLFLLGINENSEFMIKYKNIFNHNISFYNNYDQTCYKSKIQPIFKIINKKIIKNYKKEFNNFDHYINKYFFYRINKLLNQYFTIQRHFKNKEIKNIFISNLWDLESFMPVLSLDKVYTGFNYLIPHSTLLPTYLSNSRSVLLYQDKLEKLIHKKKLNFKKNPFKSKVNEYIFNDKLLNLQKNKKKRLIVLLQNNFPISDIISSDNHRNIILKNLEKLNIFFSKINDVDIYIKMHPLLEQETFWKNYFSSYLKKFTLIQNCSSEFINKNFKKFLFLYYPNKIYLNLIKKNKVAVMSDSFTIDHKNLQILLSKNIKLARFQKLIKKKNTVTIKSESDLLKYIRQ